VAGSVNKVILIGNVGKDPEVRLMQDGSKVANFSLATSERWKDAQTQELKERTQWHRVVIFQPRLSELVESYVRKGSKLYVSGQLQTRKWTDPQGQERWLTEVVVSKRGSELVFLDSKGGGSHPVPASPSDDEQQPPAAAFSEELDDDIPF